MFADMPLLRPRELAKPDSSQHKTAPAPTRLLSISLRLAVAKSASCWRQPIALDPATQHDHNAAARSRNTCSAQSCPVQNARKTGRQAELLTPHSRGNWANRMQVLPTSEKNCMLHQRGSLRMPLKLLLEAKFPFATPRHQKGRRNFKESCGLRVCLGGCKRVDSAVMSTHPFSFPS